MGDCRLDRQIDRLLRRRNRRALAWPWCHWLGRAAGLILFAAVCLLFLIIVWSHPGRGLVVVWFLLFLALLGLVC